METFSGRTFEYIVVGSGAGGGTLAARLAEAGRRVLLIEAGGDACTLAGSDPVEPHRSRLPCDYEVPAFHAFASENDAMTWRFFARHHDDRAIDEQDPKYRDQVDGRPADGVLYPRAGTLGGCTAHNAMIFVYPSNADWDYIAGLTGDPSWSATSMRRHFQAVERCRHRPLRRWLAALGFDSSRHGWRGWLPAEAAIPHDAFTDRNLRRVVIEAAVQAARTMPKLRQRLRWFRRGFFDPNDWRLVCDDAWGLRYLPLNTDRHKRYGARERVLDVAARFPDRLTIALDTLATRVLLDDSQRATGVAVLRGARLYRADTAPTGAPGHPDTAFASRGVILGGGVFNTPQLLMLSGIGPAETLGANGIDVRVPLDGVGRRLQDRYEISVVSEMDFERWEIFNGAMFSTDDAAFDEWRTRGTGLYATNGAVLTVFMRSSTAGLLPDLFCMAVLADFRGYEPDYSARFARERNYLTWVILKAHTRNAAGEVTLRSSNPRDPPFVNFRQFTEGGDEDVQALVDGMRFVRRLNDGLRKRGIASVEQDPGRSVLDEDLASYVRARAWGHHACGTCAIGPVSSGGVVDHRLRVHGTKNLRVVDASVFPRIPGFFIGSAVYMVAEKAAHDILHEDF